MWTVIRYLHLVAMAAFVGGQLTLVTAVAPAVRRHAAEETMRAAARRFGILSAVALAVIIATGAAMASHLSLWSDGTLHAKLAVIVLVFVLTGLHIATPRSHFVPYALAAASLFVVWLGVVLTNGIN